MSKIQKYVVWYTLEDDLSGEIWAEGFASALFVMACDTQPCGPGHSLLA